MQSSSHARPVSKGLLRISPFLLQNIKHCNLKHFKLNIVDEKANPKHTIGSTFFNLSETGWLESKICS